MYHKTMMTRRFEAGVDDPRVPAAIDKAIGDACDEISDAMGEGIVPKQVSVTPVISDDVVYFLVTVLGDVDSKEP